MISGLLTLIVYIAILGLVVWAITTFIPMPPAFKTLIYSMMTVAEAVELVHLSKERGIPATFSDEVGLMRAKKFYRTLGWIEKKDFYIYGGEIYFDVDFSMPSFSAGESR